MKRTGSQIPISPLEATAIVLAGGRSSRMGREKATISLEGELLIERIVRLLRPLFRDILVVLGQEHEERVKGVRYARDRIAHHGPLVGLEAGLSATRTDLNYVQACDMPFVNPHIVRRLAELAEGYDAVVPETENGLEPLHAFYRRSCLPAVEEALERGERRLSSFYPNIRVRTVSLSELRDLPGVDHAFLDLNTEGELEEIRALLEPQ